MDTGKTDTYGNNVAPTARIYLHLICRKRHLPLKLRKGKTMGCGETLYSALTQREATAVSSAASTPGNRNMRIRDCVNSPLKRIDFKGALFYII